MNSWLVARDCRLWFVAGRNVLKVGSLAVIGLTALVLLVAPARAQCVGDCDGNGTVTVDEIVRGLNDLLNGGLSCPAMECNDGPLLIFVNCATLAVGNALHGCTSFALDDAHPVALGAD